MPRTFHYIENNSPCEYTEYQSGFDSDSFNEITGKGLYFDYRPLAFYFEIGKLRKGF